MCFPLFRMLDNFKVLAVVLYFSIANFTSAQVAPVAKVASGALEKAIETAAKVSGRTLPAEARILAMRQLDDAALKHGQHVLDAARTGGLELIEVAVKHGDEVWE